jgi:hypothetical protein
VPSGTPFLFLNFHPGTVEIEPPPECPRVLHSFFEMDELVREENPFIGEILEEGEDL